MGTRTVPSARAASARIAGGYLAAQAVLGVVLWVLAFSWPWFRSLLDLVPDRPAVTDGFAVADLGVIVVASAASAWAVATDRRWAVPASAFTAGAVVYPTAYLIGWGALGGANGVVGLGLMLVVSMLCCWSAWQIWRADTAARP